MNWSEIFGTNATSIFEVIIRGSLTYVAIFVLLRILRRESGTYSVSDLIVVVVVADAAQNAMAGNYNSVPDGVVLVATIVAWSLLLDLISYRYPRVQSLLAPNAIPLIRHGVVLHPNLRRNLLTQEELRAQLHEHGLEHFAQVKNAYLEPDGQISVIPFEQGADSHSRPRLPGA